MSAQCFAYETRCQVGKWKMKTRRWNFTLECEYEKPTIIATVKLNRLRCAGHLGQKHCSKNDPNGRRGRSKPRWNDGVLVDFENTKSYKLTDSGS